MNKKLTLKKTMIKTLLDSDMSSAAGGGGRRRRFWRIFFRHDVHEDNDFIDFDGNINFNGDMDIDGAMISIGPITNR